MNHVSNGFRLIFRVMVVNLIACSHSGYFDNSAQAQNFISSVTENNQTTSGSAEIKNNVLAPLGNPLSKMKREQLNETIKRPLFAVTRRPFIEPKRVVRMVRKSRPQKRQVKRYKLLGVLMDRDRSVALVKVLGDGNHIRVGKGDQIHGWEVDLISRQEISLKKKGEKLQILYLYPN